LHNSKLGFWLVSQKSLGHYLVDEALVVRIRRCIPIIVATVGAFIWKRKSSLPEIEAFFAKPISSLQYMDCVRSILDREA
jgi:hypothetical protein